MSEQVQTVLMYRADFVNKEHYEKYLRWYKTNSKKEGFIIAQDLGNPKDDKEYPDHVIVTTATKIHGKTLNILKLKLTLPERIETQVAIGTDTKGKKVLKRPNIHPEAFCHVLYRNENGEARTVYNMRDGYAPASFQLKGVEYKSAGSEYLEYDPGYVVKQGDLVWDAMSWGDCMNSIKNRIESARRALNSKDQNVVKEAQAFLSTVPKEEDGLQQFSDYVTYETLKAFNTRGAKLIRANVVVRDRPESSQPQVGDSLRRMMDRTVAKHGSRRDRRAAERNSKKLMKQGKLNQKRQAEEKALQESADNAGIKLIK